MDYLELITKFEDNQRIPYNDLLNTTEWKERRKKIIHRDNTCCTNCGKTQSFYQFKFNITFQTKDKLKSHVIQNRSIESIKKELCIEKISILKSPYSKSTYCGLSEKGHLFLANWENINEISKSELVVNSGITEMGNTFLIICGKGQKYHDGLFSIPFISEKSINMHVHHKFYIKEKLPWDYEDSALITLCNWCHWELHEKSIIPIYKLVNNQLYELNYTPCNRCNGAGVFPEYKHVQNGICFKCNGNRYEELIDLVEGV
jgi:hypothetical protein